MSSEKLQHVKLPLKPIISRIKQILEVKSDVAVAAALDIDPVKLSVWKVRDFIPYELLISFATIMGLRLEWLLTGEGPIYKEEVKAEVPLAEEPSAPAAPPLYKEGAERRDIYYGAPRDDSLETLLAAVEEAVRKGYYPADEEDRKHYYDLLSKLMSDVINYRLERKTRERLRAEKKLYEQAAADHITEEAEREHGKKKLRGA